jgi:hypothetical protein
MWFWINFSPIGQAPSTPKKASDLQNDKKGDAKPEDKLEGSLDYFLNIKNKIKFRRKTIS